MTQDVTPNPRLRTCGSGAGWSRRPAAPAPAPWSSLGSWTGRPSWVHGKCWSCAFPVARLPPPAWRLGSAPCRANYKGRWSAETKKSCVYNIVTFLTPPGCLVRSGFARVNLLPPQITRLKLHCKMTALNVLEVWIRVGERMLVWYSAKDSRPIRERRERDGDREEEKESEKERTEREGKREKERIREWDK